jgi:hypothetical protein
MNLRKIGVTSNRGGYLDIENRSRLDTASIVGDNKKENNLN